MESTWVRVTSGMWMLRTLDPKSWYISHGAIEMLPTWPSKVRAHLYDGTTHDFDSEEEAKTFVEASCRLSEEGY